MTRGGSVHDLTYRNICMRGVANPIAISPYYTNQTTEGFVDPGYTGTKIPDYKRIVLENVVSETPGDVLIAGLNEEHRTEIALRNVLIEGHQAARRFTWPSQTFRPVRRHESSLNGGKRQAEWSDE